MSFGVSVGDLVTILQLVNKIRERFVDAPNQFTAISDEVRSLSIIVEDVKVVLPQRDISKKQRKDLGDILAACDNTLNNLNAALDKYEELDSDPKHSAPKSFSFKFRRVWKRLIFEPEDIKVLRSRITSNVTLLDAFNGQLIRQVSSDIRDDVVRLHQRQDNRERYDQHQAILNWLTPIDYAPQHNDFFGRRKEGTGEWLLHSKEFERWIDEEKQTLFCPGIPGAGKTIIASIVVEYLWTKYQTERGIGIAYLYFNFQRQDEQKLVDVLSSLLKQLVQKQNSMPETTQDLYKHHKDRRTRPSVDEIIKELRSVIRTYSVVFIVIDALDESQFSEKGHGRFLQSLFDLQSQGGDVNIFATSRFVAEIESQFQGCLRKEILAHREDILAYLDGRIPQLLRSHISKYPDLQDLVRREVVEATHGMFLLAQLHMDSLMSKPTRGDIKLTLRNLPKGVKGLDATYEQAMQRINGQEEDLQKLAKQVLSWVIYAKRPLTTSELQHALSVRPGMSELNEDFLPEVEVVLSVCVGLVTTDENSNIIRLVHYTAQEYFERTGTHWFPTAQMDIATTCLTYLSFNTFRTGFCQTIQRFRDRLELYPLYDYAARYWGHHAASPSEDLECLTMDFLKSEAKTSGSSQAMMIAPGDDWRDSRAVPQQMTGLHLTAYLGLTEAMVALMEDGRTPNVKDTWGRTPLSYAAMTGNEATVRLLLKKDNVDPNPTDRYDMTPLCFASENGHESVVKLLLSSGRVDVESRTIFGQTSMSIAEENEHESVVKLLIQNFAAKSGSMGTEIKVQSDA